MQAFLDNVIRGLVDRPDAVRIVPRERDGATLYEIHVHPMDIARLVGRQGGTISALRTLVAAGAARQGLRCGVELNDDHGGRRRH